MTAMSGENKVTVRVEVVIEGAGDAARVTTVERPTFAPHAGGLVKPLLIITPTPSSNVPVYIIGGKNCIEATGTSPVVMGSYALKVWAMAYPSPYVDPRQSGLSSPPYGAVSDTPTGSGGWSFTRAKGNAVPGAGLGGPSGAPNSTLVVWYDFGGSTPLSVVDL